LIDMLCEKGDILSLILVMKMLKTYHITKLFCC